MVLSVVIADCFDAVFTFCVFAYNNSVINISERILTRSTVHSLSFLSICNFSYFPFWFRVHNFCSDCTYTWTLLAFLLLMYRHCFQTTTIFLSVGISIAKEHTIKKTFSECASMFCRMPSRCQSVLYGYEHLLRSVCAYLYGRPREYHNEIKQPIPSINFYFLCCLRCKPELQNCQAHPLSTGLYEDMLFSAR